MGIVLYILFLIFCIYGGFNGMPFLFLFPAITIVFVIITLCSSKGANNSGNYNQTTNNDQNSNNKKSISDDDIQDLVYFDMINKK